jgi:phospholipase/lecithinase/hemolysin
MVQNAGNTIPLSKQVSYFRSTRAEMEAGEDAEAVSRLLSRAFFLIGVGSNDMFVYTGAADDAAAFYGSLVANYSAAITDLYGMGARRLGIINVGMIGCVPRVRVLDAAGACNDGLNRLAAGFDDELRSLLPALAARLPGLAYSLADSYALTQATFADPAASGYTSIDTACCGGGRLGAETDCLPDSVLCADRRQFVFWDRVHGSQRASELSAAAYYDGGLFTAPLTFEQLARS